MKQEQSLTPLAELAAMLDAATKEDGCTIFDHTPEEIGLHVIENHVEIREGLAAVEAIERYRDRTPTPDAVNADKGLEQPDDSALRLILDTMLHSGGAFARAIVDNDDGVFVAHDDVVAAMRLACSTPASDKALMPEAAVGDLRDIITRLLPYAEREAAKEPTTDGRVRRMLQARKDRDAAWAVLTTPTPVEEPEKGAMGERVKYDAAAVEAVQRLLERGKAYLDSNGYLALIDTALPAATNAGQVEAVNLSIEQKAHRIKNNGLGGWWNDLTGAQRRLYQRDTAMGHDAAFFAGVLAALKANGDAS